jgi:predicted transcriptional regulator
MRKAAAGIEMRKAQGKAYALPEVLALDATKRTREVLKELDFERVLQVELENGWSCCPRSYCL